MALKKDTPKVTIITTVYNKEELIHKCVNPVLDHDFNHSEYVSVDNESLNKCLEICDIYAGEDYRISIF